MDKVSRAVKLYKEGYSLLGVSEEIEVSRMTVWRWLTEKGVTLRGKGRSKHKHNRFKIAKIKRLYKKESLQEIAEKEGMTPRTVKAILVKAGVKIRSRGRLKKTKAK